MNNLIARGLTDFIGLLFELEESLPAGQANGSLDCAPGNVGTTQVR